MNLTVQPMLYSRTASLKKTKQNGNKQQTYATSQIQAKQITFKGNENKFNYDEHYQQNLNAQNGFLGIGNKKRAKDMTEAQSRAFYEAMADRMETDRLSTKGFEEQQKKDREIIENMRNEIKGLRENLANSNKSDKENETLKKEMAEKEAQFNQRINDLEKKNKEHEDFKDLYNRQTERKAGHGWESMAGNESIKSKLDESFIRKLSAEQTGTDVKIPNGVLFYGPKSTGKTSFAKAFAEQAGCNFEEIDMLQADEKIMQDLFDAANQSKIDYTNSGQAKKRTVILLDECDSIANNSEEDLNKVLGKSVKAKLKNFLQKCSNDFKCTVFMTTNHPLDIDSEMLGDQRIPVKVFLGPPEKEDAAAIFKHYLKGETEQVINYDRLADEVMKARETNSAFSAGHIELIVDTCTEAAQGLKQKVTEKGLIDTITELGPDISSKKMEKFAKEIAEMTKQHI